MDEHPVRRPLIIQLVIVNVVTLMVWLLVVNLLIGDLSTGLLNTLVVVLVGAQLLSSVWVVLNWTREKEADKAEHTAHQNSRGKTHRQR